MVMTLSKVLVNPNRQGPSTASPKNIVSTYQHIHR